MRRLEVKHSELDSSTDICLAPELCISQMRVLRGNLFLWSEELRVGVGSMWAPDRAGCEPRFCHLLASDIF